MEKKYTTEEILTLMDRFARNKLSSLEINDGSFSLKFGKETPVAAAPAVAAAPMAALPAAEQSDTEPPVLSGKVVKSPIVGTFYCAPAPDKDPFVKVGQRVAKGDVLFIVESMKLMNEVTSEYDGVVSRVLIENGQPLEYGTPVMEIE